MNILVTGAAGFIGYHLSLALAKNNEVVGIDNINDYYDVDLKFNRLNQAGFDRKDIREGVKLSSKIYPALSFNKSDLTNLSALEALFNKENFDVVINLAAQAGVRYSLENPHAYVQSNLIGFVNLLECCRHNNIKHLIYASSSSVYGMNKKTPFSEDDNVDYPVSLYAATKKANELLAHTYSHLYQLPTTGLRFFTVYGPWGRPDMAPMIFANAIINDKPIKVFNNGDMERDFTYIDDIVQGIVNIIDKTPDRNEEHPYYRLFNIGNSKPVKLMEFISILENELGKTTIKKMLPMQAGDVPITFADTTKLEKISGYKPNTVLKAGVKNFIDWYRAYNK